MNTRWRSIGRAVFGFVVKDTTLPGRFLPSLARAAIVWLLSYPLFFVAWSLTASYLLRGSIDPQLVGGVSAWVFSILLAIYEFWRSDRRNDPPAA